MLGKRPRPLQRTRSKMQLAPDENLHCSPAVEPSHEKPKLSTPAFGVARQVIGFNPVNKDIDAVGSPRSVLTNVGSGCSQTRSPRSSRSGLEGVISIPRPWEKKGSDGVGLGIVAALSTVEDVPRIPTMGSPKTLMIPFQCAASSACQRPPSLSHSQPIPIGQPQSPSTSRWNGYQHRQACCSPADVFEESFAWSSHGVQSHGNKQEHLPVYGTSADTEMEARESIFSAASPASSCSENYGHLLDTDFLSTCYFCKRQLFHGKDVYMYRGDRAFCSVECRYQQIVLDERKEKCSASALKSGNSAASSYTNHGGRGLTGTTAAAA